LDFEKYYMRLLRILVWPLAMLYKLITDLRNHLYNIGSKPSIRFEVPVIGVGNLIAGGAGKTPMIEYLVRLLSSAHKLATLSRGYGRKTSGFRIASDVDHAGTIGDEPMQLYQKYGDRVTVAVGADRAMAIPEILYHQPETEVMLLDDVFQHRSVQPHLNILLTEFEKPFFSDYTLPYGMLRESRKGARRADVIVVTKCPAHLDDSIMHDFRKRIEKYSGHKPVFFTAIRYLEPRHFFDSNAKLHQNVVLLTGIANSHPFEKYVSTKYTILRHFKFPDHHVFSQKELNEVFDFVRSLDKPCAVLTTEKDMVRLKSGGQQMPDQDFPVFYLPIECFFIKDGQKFDNIVRQSIRKVSE